MSGIFFVVGMLVCVFFLEEGCLVGGHSGRLSLLVFCVLRKGVCHCGSGLYKRSFFTVEKLQ